MPMSKNIATYSDVKRVLLLALSRKDGLIFTPYNGQGKSSKGTAKHFVQRAYTYRKLLAELRAGTTIFDELKFTPKEEKVIIRQNIPEGVFTDLNGSEIPLEDIDEERFDEEEDPLLQAAKKVRDEIFDGE